MSRIRIAAASLALTLAAPSVLSAQWQWGALVGGHMATLTGDDVTDAKMKFGLVAGAVLVRQAEGSKMFWQTGVQFSQRGSGFESAGFTATNSINYLEVPVMAGWTFPTATGSMNPFITGGVILALTMSCDFEGGGSSVDCKDDVTSIDFPLAFGGGVKDVGPNGAWGFSALYNLGLATIDNPASGTAGDVKNSGFTFVATYMFKKKKP